MLAYVATLVLLALLAISHEQYLNIYFEYNLLVNRGFMKVFI